jgi:hypothetical protein
LNEFVLVIVPIIALVLAAAGTWYARRAAAPVVREERRQRRHDRFREVRAWMRKSGNQRKIVEAAYRTHEDLLAAGPMHVFITDPAWVLAEPLELDRLTVELVGEDARPPVPEACYEPLRQYWPLGADGKPVARYHEAVTQFDTPPGLWFNWPSYRLLGVERRADGGFALRVGTTTYWDGFDSWAALQFEAAHQLREREAGHRPGGAEGARLTGPYRQSLGTPFSLTNRDCAIGLSVLTVYRTRKGAFFYLQRRAAAQVAVAGGLAGLLPAGEFQPSSAAYAAVRSDADIWRCIMREFAEEVVGRPDLEQRGPSVDYERESPFRELQRARRDGSVRPYILNIGFDPVTWKAGIRLVWIFDEDAHRKIFRGMQPDNSEGSVEAASLHRVGKAPLEGMPFNEETVRGYLQDPTITEAARLCIGLTWEHREKLGLLS